MQSQLLRRMALQSRSGSLLRCHSSGLFFRPSETCIVQHYAFSAKARRDRWQLKGTKEGSSDSSSSEVKSTMNAPYHQQIEKGLTDQQIKAHRRITRTSTHAGPLKGRPSRHSKKRDVNALYNVIEEQLGKEALTGVDKFHTRLATDFAFASPDSDDAKESKSLSRSSANDPSLLASNVGSEDTTSEEEEENEPSHSRSSSSSAAGLGNRRKGNAHGRAQYQQSRSKSTSAIPGSKPSRSKSSQTQDSGSDSSSKSRTIKKKVISKDERAAKAEAAREEATRYPTRTAAAAELTVSELEPSESTSLEGGHSIPAADETPYVPKKGPQKPSDKVKTTETILDPKLMNEHEIRARRLGAFAFDSERDSLKQIDELRKKETGVDIHHVSHQSLRANMNREEEVEPFSLGGLFVMLLAVSVGYYLYKVDQKKHTGIRNRKKKKKPRKKISDIDLSGDSSAASSSSDSSSKFSDFVEKWSPFHSREFTIEELIIQQQSRPLKKIPDEWSVIPIITDHLTNLMIPGRYNSENLYSKLFRLFGIPEQKLLPTMKQKEYGGRTLVIDLDTICHSVWHREKGITRTIRPHYYELIQSAAMSGWEIVLFGSNTEDMEFMESPEEMGKLDGKGFVAHYLWSKDAYYFNGHRCKDLARLNRDPNRVLVIDSDTRNVQLQPRNAIMVSPWFGDEESLDEIKLTNQELTRLVERELDKDSLMNQDLMDDFDVEEELKITRESEYREADRKARERKRNEIIVRLSELTNTRDRELDPLINFLQYIMKADVQSIPDMLDDYRDISEDGSNNNSNECMNIGDEFNRRYQLHMVNERRKYQGLPPVSSLKEERQEKGEQSDEEDASIDQLYQKLYWEIYADHETEEEKARKKKLGIWANRKNKFVSVY